MSGLTKRHIILCAALLSIDFPQATSAGPAGDRQKSAERVPFTAEAAASARPDGLPGTVRIPADDPRAFQSLIEAAPAASDPWLVLSGGGENGAFAAGLLSGWSEAGTRPAFGVITGVSTGALIAPFAFVGPQGDPVLRQNYTDVSAADVFEFGGTEEALTDNWPLKRRIERAVTPKLLKAIAAEHAKGRRLLVATTEVDTERAVLWDMGAIAAAGGEKALKLFREVVLASTAVPGVFPPVLVDAVGPDGKKFREMHDDGGALAPFFIAPEAALLGQDEGAVRLPTRAVYVVVNNRLTPDFHVTARTTLGVLGRTMSAAIKAQTRAALALTKGFAAREGIDLHVARIDGRFTQTSAAPFDQKYMQALFAHGASLGRDGTAFTVEAKRPAETSAPAGTGKAAALPAAPQPATRDLAAR